MSKLSKDWKRKDKTTAVLLAIFFSFWTFAYTYKYNGWKFWLYLVISISFWWMLFIPNVIIWILSMVEAISTPSEFYEEYYED